MIYYAHITYVMILKEIFYILFLELNSLSHTIYTSTFMSRYTQKLTQNRS